MANLKYGIVGYGPRAGRVESSIGKKMDLVEIFDPNPEAQKKAENDGLGISDSYDEFIGKDLDAVVIGSPPQFHAEQAIKALEAGLHVFSEVPMAIKIEDIQNIINADENNPNAIYMLGENNCYDPDVLYAQHLVSSGKIGPVVYGEQEYVHDVSYRWRGRNVDDYKNSETHENWYSKFDPLAYAHTILPGQVAMGGLNSPMKFVEVQSYANDIGGENGNPVCGPAKAYHVGLFKSDTGAICKCNAAYVYARKPTRYTCMVVGRFGSFESEGHGNKKARAYLCDGFNIKRGSRKGKAKDMTKWLRLKRFLKKQGFNPLSQNKRLTDEWISAIREKRDPTLSARTVANACHAGLAASKAAREGKPQKIKTYEK